jgi:hypothetical protein
VHNSSKACVVSLDGKCALAVFCSSDGLDGTVRLSLVNICIHGLTYIALFSKLYSYQKVLVGMVCVLNWLVGYWDGMQT